MSVRDQFAAAALNALISADAPESIEEIAEEAYQYAESMVMERDRTNQEAGPRDAGGTLGYDDESARMLYERDHAKEELSLLQYSVRQLLDGINERHPEKNPREWTCQDLALLDRLVPPNHDAAPAVRASETPRGGDPGTGNLPVTEPLKEKRSRVSYGQPVAWGVLRVGGGWMSIANSAGEAEASRLAWDEAENWFHVIVPLYSQPQPTLSAAERAAIYTAAEWLSKLARSAAPERAGELFNHATTLLGLAGRMS